MASRSIFLGGVAGALGAAAIGRAANAAAEPASIVAPFENGYRPVVALAQKRPLIMLSPRPPLLETPFSVFDRGILTPNDAFFVRWHLSMIPEKIDASAHRIAVTGTERTLSLSLANLKNDYEQVTIVAVNQCSGNSRGFFGPRVAGGQWQNGAMGNARWKGVRLRDVLAKAGLKAGTKQIQFQGLERAPITSTPLFRKSLDLDVAQNENVIIAYEMNGAPLPVLNGFPVRLVVPGYFSTYWTKMLAHIRALDTVDDNFWMKTAYRIPDTPNNGVLPTDKGFPTIPIGPMRVRSFATNIIDGGTLAAGNPEIRGIAFDNGSGIAKVELSADGGTTWLPTTLDADAGPFSFRRWSTRLDLVPSRSLVIACRATSNAGVVQPVEPVWTPGGYLKNNIETYKVTVA